MADKLYFAPLEGITTHIYRNAHKEMFGVCDSYYTPFISPSDNEKIGRKGFRDILPENNVGTHITVQTLTNNSSSFIKFSQKVQEYGYSEINLNLGCPSATVVGKGRGSGFLKNTVELDRFLYEIFEKIDISISVKTRIGFEVADEMAGLLRIYNKYPISLLTVHPRTRTQFYKGEPDMETFKMVYENSKNPVAYNANVYSCDDYTRIKQEFSELEGVMIGRGAIQNPAIFREIRGGKPLSTDELLKFSEKLRQCYEAKLDSSVFTLHKLKEVWLYMMGNFPEEKKILKAVKKAATPEELIRATQFLPEL